MQLPRGALDGGKYGCFGICRVVVNDEGEGDKIHIANNLMTGFLSRAEHTTKYTFGRHCVLGEEGGL